MSGVDTAAMLSFVLLLAGLAVGCTQQGMYDCDSAPLTQAESPDGRYVARARAMQCGATTGDAVWVLLSEKGASVDEARDRVAVFEGRTAALAWKGGALVVATPGGRSFFAAKESKGVPIRHVAGLSEERAINLAEPRARDCFHHSLPGDAAGAVSGTEMSTDGWLVKYESAQETCAIHVGFDGHVELSSMK